MESLLADAGLFAVASSFGLVSLTRASRRCSSATPTLRWNQMRRRIAPRRYALGALLNPVLGCARVFLLGALGIASRWADASTLMPLGGAGRSPKAALDSLISERLAAGLRHQRHASWVPLEDLLVFALWVLGAFTREVQWGGKSMRICSGSRWVLPNQRNNGKTLAKAL